MVKWWPIVKIVRARSDEEFVEQARLSVKQVEVIRWPMLLLYALALVASLGIPFWAIQQWARPRRVDLAIGVFCGFACGTLMHLGLYGILKLLETQRTRKLMIKYYDAIQELADSQHITRSTSTPGTSA